jgi:hypothetical protein
MADRARSKFSRADELAQQLFACCAEFIGHLVAQHDDAAVVAALASPQPKPNWKARTNASKIAGILRIAESSLVTAIFPAQ